MNSLKALSTTESLILGFVWQNGPCTTYSVMRELAMSGSTFFRNRATTTYRLVNRLAKAGLLKYESEESGPRNDRLVTITDPGAREVKRWLSPPIPRAEVAYIVDLVRLRMFFVKFLSSQERIALLDDALSALRDLLQTMEDRNLRYEDPIEQMAGLGAIYETRARIAWLEEIRPKLTVQV